MDWGALAGAVAWPLTALVALFVLRPQVVALFDALRVKLGQADEIALGRDGLRLVSTIARQNIVGGSRSGGSQLDGPVVAGLLAAPAEAEEDERAEFERLVGEFERLVGEYGTCDTPDLAERVRVRNRLSDRLGALRCPCLWTGVSWRRAVWKGAW